MDCKFVVGQRVVCKRLGIPENEHIREARAKGTPPPSIEEGNIYSITRIEPDRDGLVGLAFEEVPPYFVDTPFGRALVLWDHREFWPLKDQSFWIGQEAADKLKSGRGLEVPKHTDDYRRNKVRLP